jgi:catechol 2,3-dioxygenase-like lactoylglutathione lyase family enzyme
MSAIGSMNHVAFDVEPEQIEACITRLTAAGVPHLPVVVNHDDSPMGVSPELNDGVFVRSVYFTDPNGIMMEFAAWTRSMRPDDVRHEPKGAMVEA